MITQSRSMIYIRSYTSGFRNRFHNIAQRNDNERIILCITWRFRTPNLHFFLVFPD